MPSTETVVAYSDCIDVRTEQECTKLITYTNSSNFDGIDYETANPIFYLRVPAMFHEEDNPMTVEDLELSNDEIVILRQDIKEKRKLETGYMPNYMHKKLQKVLMHDTVTIDGDNWARRDAYETNPIKNYLLKMASVWLTKINSIDRNII